jgi:hypothetical protein
MAPVLHEQFEPTRAAFVAVRVGSAAALAVWTGVVASVFADAISEPGQARAAPGATARIRIKVRNMDHLRCVDSGGCSIAVSDDANPATSDDAVVR